MELKEFGRGRRPEGRTPGEEGGRKNGRLADGSKVRLTVQPTGGLRRNDRVSISERCFHRRRLFHAHEGPVARAEQEFRVDERHQ